MHAHLENAGIAAWVVNAHFIKHVPGRKTDMSDSQWLAVLARFGLVRASFIPPKDLRELRLVSRCRRKLTQMHSAELNRLHKVLDDAGIKPGGVVSDINGVSATAMVKGLIEGQGIDSLLGLARGACGGADPHRDRRRHGALRLRRAAGLVGRAVPGQQRECRQAPQSRAGRATATASSGTSCASAPMRQE